MHFSGVKILELRQRLPLRDEVLGGAVKRFCASSNTAWRRLKKRILEILDKIRHRNQQRKNFQH